jgi:hypothetical protein
MALRGNDPGLRSAELSCERHSPRWNYFQPLAAAAIGRRAVAADSLPRLEAEARRKNILYLYDKLDAGRDLRNRLCKQWSAATLVAQPGRLFA